MLAMNSALSRANREPLESGSHWGRSALRHAHKGDEEKQVEHASLYLSMRITFGFFERVRKVSIYALELPLR